MGKTNKMSKIPILLIIISLSSFANTWYRANFRLLKATEPSKSELKNMPNENLKRFAADKKNGDRLLKATQPSKSELKEMTNDLTKRFATGKNGDENLDEDIKMKGDKHHT